MSARVRLSAALVGLLGFVGALGVQDARAAQIVLNLDADGTLEVIVDGGARIRSSVAPGPLIPPGTYLAVISTDVPDARDEYHMFHLSGPGVNLQTDLLAGDERAEPHTVTFLPSSTYVFQDERRPQAGRVVFSTSGAGTAVAQASGGSPGSSSTGGSGATSSSGTAKNTDVVGSEIVRVRGTLNGGVDTARRLRLTVKGKAVSSLKSGRYRIVVLDETARGGFTLQRLGKVPVKLTGTAFVGRKVVTMALAPGQWMFFGGSAKKSFFIVVA